MKRERAAPDSPPIAGARVRGGPCGRPSMACRLRRGCREPEDGGASRSAAGRADAWGRRLDRAHGFRSVALALRVAKHLASATPRILRLVDRLWRCALAKRRS